MVHEPLGVEEIGEDTHSRTSSRPVFLSRLQVLDIHVRLAVLNEKLDNVLQDRDTVDAHTKAIHELQLFQAKAQTWAAVAGVVWSLVLALIGAGVFFR